MFSKKKHVYLFALGLAAAFAITSVFVSDNFVSAANNRLKSISIKIGKKNVAKKSYSLA